MSNLTETAVAFELMVNGILIFVIVAFIATAINYIVDGVVK